MRNQAILSFLYQRTPGAFKPVFEIMDLLNLPNPSQNMVEDVIKSDLNVTFLILRS
jgi:hypothetical protein